jgi:hypothetical protein
VLRPATNPLLQILPLAAFVLLGGVPGCAAVKASRQPDKKNLGVLHEGTPRAQVIAELGAPTYTKPRPDGTIEDVFSFKQGYTKGVKMGRAFVHGAADVATGGLWEVIGIPAEIWADGTEVQVLVTYDQDEHVRYRRVFKGQEVFKDRSTTASGQSAKVAAKPPADSSRRESDGAASDASEPDTSSAPDPSPSAL